MKWVSPHKTQSESLVFLNRNKAYGAYQLRKNYPRRMALSGLISIVSFLLIMLLNSIDWTEKPDYEMMQEVEWLPQNEISLPKYHPNPTSAAKSDKKLSATDSEKKKVVREEKPIEKENTQDEKKDSSNLQKEGLTEAEHSENKEDVVFDFVDVMPQYPGGNQSLSRFISSKLVYPNTALRNRIEGVVIVGFIIDKEGKLRNPRILKSLYPACDEEALRVLRLVDTWIPAKNSNRNVSFNYKMPIEFKLNR